MSASDVYLQHEEWLTDYDNNAEAWNHQEQLNQRQREGNKMAQFEPKDNTITLWVNDKRESEKSPNMTGKGLVNGKEVRAAAWKNTSQKGSNYLSIKLSDPQDNAKRFTPAPKDFDF